MKAAILSLVGAALVSEVIGHGAVTSYTITSNGVSHEYPGFEGFSPQSSPDSIQRPWPSYDPVFKVNDAMMTCNGGTTAKLTAPINGGDNITAHWKQWTHAQGPVMVWLYACQGEFATCTGKEQRWFKIDQLGLYGKRLTSEDWGTGVVLRTNKWTSRIPSNLQPGNYLIRHELIALHQANTPQFYPECAQLVLKSNGNAMPPATHLKSIPAYAPQTDPGVTVDTYGSTATTYTCPGGPVWNGWKYGGM